VIGLEPLAVDIWLAVPELSLDSRILCDQERARLDRFVFAHNRAEYLAAHVLLRAVLSAYVDFLPSQWRFVEGVNGRPEIAGEDAAWLRFNLSRTTGLVVVALARCSDIGVDVEDVCRAKAPLEIADEYFAPSEVQALRALPDVQQDSAFFDYWTLKEAYIKALGLGLSAPLERFAFELRSRERPCLGVSLGGDSREWQFQLFSPTRCHRLAVALHSEQAMQTRLRRVAWPDVSAEGVIRASRTPIRQ
jgi:4'-phosphopantetheinyl transferase